DTPAANMGLAQSIRVVVPSFNSAAGPVIPQVLNNPGLVSACINVTGPAQNTATNFKIPIGKTGAPPFGLLVRTFSGGGCTGVKEDFVIQNGIVNTPTTSYKHFSNGANTRLYVTSIGGINVIDHISFQPGPTVLAAGACSPPFEVATKNAAFQPVAVATTTLIGLSSAGGTADGSFHAFGDGACATSVSTSAIIGSATSTYFRFKKATSANPTVLTATSVSFGQDTALLNVTPPPPPVFASTSPTLVPGNYYLDLAFDQQVWGDNAQSSAIAPADFTVNFDNGGSPVNTVNIWRLTTLGGTALLGGESEVRIWLSSKGIATSTEQISFNPVTNSIFGPVGAPAPVSTNSGSSTFQFCSQAWGCGSENFVQNNVTITSSVTGTRNFIVPGAGGRKFGHSRRVTNITGASDDTFITGGPAWGDQEFLIGDEVLWVVMAAGSTSSCGPIGTDKRGSFGFAKIINVDTPAGASHTQMTIDPPMGAGTIVTTKANLALTPSNPDFCYIQVQRVPHFYDLTVNTTFVISPDPWDYAVGEGGILALKVQNILDMKAVTKFDATGMGFNSPNAIQGGQGDSWAATSTITTAPNSGGGGGSNDDSNGGGGGGNGGSTLTGGNGVGGNGGGGSFGTGGLVSPDCGGSGCAVAIGAGGMQMGAAGGNAGLTPVASGGAGGGVVFVQAKSLAATYDGSLVANGSPGATNGNTNATAGAGAGGSVYFGVRDATGVATAYTINSNGGAALGSASNAQGGGGAGGAAFSQACTGMTVPVTPFANSGGGGAGPSAGSNGFPGRQGAGNTGTLCGD
ncbi:MAG: hypothetical protein HN509_06355, partial [Halobacteriovoraceae bacterium]|nr:hypothetical protein [Halobacteriovoraceae bacterium]